MTAIDSDSVAVPKLPTTRNLVQHAYERGDLNELARLINERPLEVWFAFTGSELSAIISVIPEDMRSANTAISSFNVLLHGGEVPGVDWAGQVSDQEETTEDKHGNARLLIASLYHRARGQVRKAAMLNRSHPRDPSRSSLIDPFHGRDLFLAVQSGITEMLMGDYQRALTHFTSAELLSTKPELRFLLRDANAKAALIHALFGDHYTAQTLVKRAANLSRTESWAERGIDATIALVRILLKREFAAQTSATRQLDEIPLHDLGEMWPFYIIAMHRLYLVSGRNEEFIARIRLLEQAAFPRTAGEGVPGTVFPATIAVSALLLGRTDFARTVIEEADPGVPNTQIVLGLFALHSGDFAEAIRLQQALEPETHSLRQLEISRSLILATALLESGDQEGAEAQVARLIQRMGDLGVHELFLVGPEIRELIDRQLAARRDESGPGLGAMAIGVAEASRDAASSSASGRAAHVIRLTPRESDVLRLCRRGLRRTEIAERLGISLNTVKTHQRGLFKKLQVRSMRELLEESERLGLVGQQ